MQEMEDVGLSQVSIVTIEEFQSTTPWHLAQLHRVCQLNRGVDAPFGGCLIIHIGDLRQLPPVEAGPDPPRGVVDVNLDNGLTEMWYNRARGNG